MSNAMSAVTPIAGVGLNRRTNSTTETNPIEHALGTTVLDSDGRVWIYVYAAAAISANSYVTILWWDRNSVGVSSVPGTTAGNAGVNGSAAFAAGDYGWVKSINRIPVVTATNA